MKFYLRFVIFIVIIINHFYYFYHDYRCFGCGVLVEDDYDIDLFEEPHHKSIFAPNITIPLLVHRSEDGKSSLDVRLPDERTAPICSRCCDKHIRVR